VPPRTNQVLVAAADKFDRRAEVGDIPGRQIEDNRLDLKTDALCAGEMRTNCAPKLRTRFRHCFLMEERLWETSLDPWA
jgi:hypothetical protein